MKKLLEYGLALLLAVTTATTGCKEKKKLKQTEPSPKIEATTARGYDFNQVEKLEMKNRLKEISGIHYLNGNLFVAIEDEDGIIFTVDFATGKIVDQKVFAGRGDFEDITMDAKFFYVLESNGKIYRVSRNDDTSKLSVNALQNNSGSEFESVYLDPAGKNLVFICKNCPGEKKHGINAYAFNLQDARFNDLPAYTINMDVLSKEERSSGLKPSAAAIHPIEKKLYVLCSLGKMLLVCDLQGKVEKGYHLNPEIFQQPEGIAFTPNGDLFISNESNHSKANILKFPYRSL